MQGDVLRRTTHPPFAIKSKQVKRKLKVTFKLKQLTYAIKKLNFLLESDLFYFGIDLI